MKSPAPPPASVVSLPPFLSTAITSTIGLIIAIVVVAAAVNAASPEPLSVHPLAPRSGDGSAMHFTAIPASASGLTNLNPYDDRSMWSTARYTEFQGGAIGTGIASGDVDGDGWTDLYVVNKTHPNQLFRQTAPFQFTDVTAAWQTGATFADIDNDGDLDLYVCQFDAPNQLFINDGSGHFTEDASSRGAALTSASVVGAFADYDRDGHLDLFILTNVHHASSRPHGEADHLLRNRGDGTFEKVTVSAGISGEMARGHSASWFDANADGWPDLYIANDFAQPDHLYQNNGDGTFPDTSDRALPATPSFAMGSDFGDINNDGLLDLFGADMVGTTHFKSKVTMGDMGGLVDAMDSLATPQYMRNHLYLNTGTDRFAEIAQLAGVKSSDWSWSPRFEDLDNDGWLDLHITNGMVRSFIDSDLVNKTRRLNSPTEVIRLMKKSPPLAETLLTFRNNGQLHFDKVQEDWGLDHTGVSFGSTFADFDHDGDLDLAYINYDASVSLYRNDSPSGHRVIIELVGTTSNARGIDATAIIEAPQGKLTHQLSVARDVLSSSEPLLHFGLRDFSRIGWLTIQWPSGHEQHFTDLPADHRLVITEPSTQTSPAVAVTSRPVNKGFLQEIAASHGIDYTNTEVAFNDMVRQSLLPHRMNTLGGGLAIADANGDHAPDIFFAGSAGVTSALYLNDGHGHFARSNAPQGWDAPPASNKCPPSGSTSTAMAIRICSSPPAAPNSTSAAKPSPTNSTSTTAPPTLPLPPPPGHVPPQQRILPHSRRLRSRRRSGYLHRRPRRPRRLPHRPRFSTSRKSRRNSRRRHSRRSPHHRHGDHRLDLLVAGEWLAPTCVQLRRHHSHSFHQSNWLCRATRLVELPHRRRRRSRLPRRQRRPQHQVSRLPRAPGLHLLRRL
ncbi:MAG: CRTAC1 family protein [Candidatus Synoicihabitans palmerolidicus]|nr:CRTAC1 family protein [Candidatus Synoicihabitans palmerolidicus]